MPTEKVLKALKQLEPYVWVHIAVSGVDIGRGDTTIKWWFSHKTQNNELVFKSDYPNMLMQVDPNNIESIVPANSGLPTWINLEF
jgi:hypothetical protein